MLERLRKLRELDSSACWQDCVDNVTEELQSGLGQNHPDDAESGQHGQGLRDKIRWSLLAKLKINGRIDSFTNTKE